MGPVLTESFAARNFKYMLRRDRLGKTAFSLSIPALGIILLTCGLIAVVAQARIDKFVKKGSQEHQLSKIVKFCESRLVHNTGAETPDPFVFHASIPIPTQPITIYPVFHSAQSVISEYLRVRPPPAY